jgi:hypothetical protein
MFRFDASAVRLQEQAVSRLPPVRRRVDNHFLPPPLSSSMETSISNILSYCAPIQPSITSPESSHQVGKHKLVTSPSTGSGSTTKPNQASNSPSIAVQQAYEQAVASINTMRQPVVAAMLWERQHTVRVHPLQTAVSSRGYCQHSNLPAWWVMLAMRSPALAPQIVQSHRLTCRT